MSSCQTTEDPCVLYEATIVAKPLDEVTKVLQDLDFELVQDRVGWKIYERTIVGTNTRSLAYKLLGRLRSPFLSLNKDVETSLGGQSSQFFLFTHEGTLAGGYVQAVVTGGRIEDTDLRAMTKIPEVAGRRMSLVRVAVVWRSDD